ncbi:MAG: glycoside hydrolase family 31 protein [Paludibacteraceae bacterium]|nr:glycoside hydrolase family 31 protein [Paludibacteraceae bacterium]
MKTNSSLATQVAHHSAQRFNLSLLLLFLSLSTLSAANWFGGSVGLGHEQPYTNLRPFNMSVEDANNQLCPLFLSDDGQYIWTENPVIFSFKDGELQFQTTIGDSRTIHHPQSTKAGTTLRDAYLAAMRQYFPPSGVLPDTLFFIRPQYNTWIELMYNQNQTDILRYAHAIVDNGFDPGILMIDDNWQRYYGNFDFKAERFSDPKGMIDELHELGFTVMVWICPFVSADSPEYRDLERKGYLLQNPNGGTAVLNWWNGYSACYDLTNPDALAHFVSVLKDAQARYGIDGFKFDAGDNNCYASTSIKAYDTTATTVDHTTSWAKVGLQFPVNEYRACWKMGGQALVQRLGDKDYSWEAVQSLIPQMTTAGLLGYAYACPDMIGGGQWASFLGIESGDFDEELIVRSAQIHALMPMMQFSVAPWRILSEENLTIVKKAAALHSQFGAYILVCARQSAQTGEPIVRSMEYAFPHQGLVNCKDQFMLGDKYLVAPVVEQGAITRTVYLPKGQWRDELGKRYRGGKAYTISAPLSRLPYFEKLK